MCVGTGVVPPSSELKLPIDLPDMRVGRVVRRYSVYSHFYFIDITFGGIASGTVLPVIVRESLCPAFTYPPVRMGDIVRVFGEMEAERNCFEAHAIELFEKWDVNRFGVFQFRGPKYKSEDGERGEDRKLVVVLQCQSEVVKRVDDYLSKKINKHGYDVEESCTPLTVSNERLLLVWKRPSGTLTATKKICLEIYQDPIIRYAVSRVYTMDKQRTHTGLSVEEAMCALLNNTSIKQESHRVRIHAFPKFLDFAETHLLLKTCAPEVVFSPTNYTHVLVVLYANGIFYLSYLEKPLALGCGENMHQDSNQACLAVSKAAAKILEAVSRSGLNLQGLTALDIGAAPGGWSYYLKNVALCDRVIAVDMGALAAPIPEGVEHWRMKGQEAIDILASKSFLIDIYTCDMNVSPIEAVELFLQAIPLMQVSGVAIITFKRTEKNKAKWNALKAEGLRRLNTCEQVRSVEETHLIANTPNETTVVIRLA